MLLTEQEQQALARVTRERHGIQEECDQANGEL